MSFRDLRNFTEMMRVLGYPRLISVGNFRLPNFPLVAEILVWLLKRFDPDADISSEHNTEEERISLIRAVAEFMDTEQSLDTRIERRRAELDRNQKRLQTLRKVRPAFMEEFEKLEVELRVLYEDYIQKFRYLAYLEHLYEDAAKMEQERFERRQEATRKQLEKMRAEDANFESIMEGNDSILPINLQEPPPPLADTEKQNTEKTTPSSRLKSAGRSSRTQISQRRIYGSMSGRQRGTIQESNDSGGSLDSDSDLLIDGDLDDDDDDDDILDSVGGPEIGNFDLKVGQEKRAVSKLDHSDEDF